MMVSLRGALSSGLIAVALVSAPGHAHAQAGPGERLAWFDGSPGADRSVAVAPARAYGPSFPSMDGPSSEPDGRPAEIAVRSWACLAGGLAGTTLAAAFGAENVMNIIAGGAVAPVSTAALYIGLAGVVYLSYCSIAQELTPLVRYYLRTRARE